MASSKLSDLTGLTVFSGDELFYVVEDDDGSPVSRKVTIEDLATGLASYLTSSTSVAFSKPTHGTTRNSTTLGAFGTAWTDTIATDASQGVRYSLTASITCSANSVIYLGLTRAGTLIDRCNIYTAGDGTRENRMTLTGIDVPGSAATHTYEVYGAASSGTVTISSTIDTNTGTNLGADGVSSLQLQVVTVV